MKKIGIICKSGRTEPVELVKLLHPVAEGEAVRGCSGTRGGGSSGTEGI